MIVLVPVARYGAGAGADASVGVDGGEGASTGAGPSSTKLAISEESVRALRAAGVEVLAVNWLDIRCVYVPSVCMFLRLSVYLST